MKTERRHFDTIGSTNTWAKQNAHLFDRESMTLVTADEQTAGRGRFQRQWVSPPKQNIYATFCFFVDKSRPDIGNIPQIMAIAAVKTLEKFKLNAKIKWPNDVVVNEKKIAGILCETTLVDDSLCVVLGIGLNVNMPREMLRKIDRPATSLLAEFNNEFSVDDILIALIETFNGLLVRFLKEGFTSFYGLYINYLTHHLSHPIRLQDGNSYTECTFHSINPDGSLNVMNPSGVLKNHRSGEILY